MNILEICTEAVALVDFLTQADADNAVSEILDGVIAVLRCDPRMPRLSREQWDALFSGAESRSRDRLGALINDRVDFDTVLRKIAEAAEVIETELAVKSYRQRVAS